MQCFSIEQYGWCCVYRLVRLNNCVLNKKLPLKCYSLQLFNWGLHRAVVCSAILLWPLSKSNKSALHVRCFFFLFNHQVMSDSCDPIDYSPPGPSIHGILQARTPPGVGCHILLQGIFLAQGLNLWLLHRQVDSLPPSHVGSLVVKEFACQCMVCKIYITLF